jgi:hypothetical protein
MAIDDPSTLVGEQALGFRLWLGYKPGATNVVADALS